MHQELVENNPLIGESDAFHELLEKVSELAKINKPVLVIGERGTGKELIAARLHYLSRRWDRQFIKLNCAALTETLLESEMFGHEAGSFTGAVKKHLGRFERAHKGTLFLDEISNTPLRLQEKILRAIEYGEFERVGGSATVRVNVRVVAATNVDLPFLAEAGRFRHDLLDRLSFDVITIPPLRARGEDIMVLAEHFAVRMVRELEGEFSPGFTEEARQTLMSYSWPGNVRELKNVVERSVYRAFGTGEPVSDIQIDPFKSKYRPAAEGYERREKEKDLPEAADRVRVNPYHFPAEVEKYEIRLLTDALKQNQFRQTATARFLGLTYNQLRGLLKKYTITGRGHSRRFQ